MLMLGYDGYQNSYEGSQSQAATNTSNLYSVRLKNIDLNHVGITWP